MSNADSRIVASGQIDRHTSFGFVGKARLSLSALLAAISCVLLTALLAASPASAVCPNEVFRSGPSAKLPDCRAYELVTPAYTGGIKPGATNFSNMWHGFDFQLMTDDGNSVLFNTTGAALSGTPGNGFNDRYRAVRTANGWVTELAGPTAVETTRLTPGPASSEHAYQFLNAGLNDFNLEPESTLQAAYGGKQVDYLRKPDGSFELIGTGSLGSVPRATGHLIAPGGSHVIFSAETPLEPNASPEKMTTIYDRPATGSTTHVVSLLPDGTAPTPIDGRVEYLGTSADGSEVVWATHGTEFGDQTTRMFVRVDNSVTKEIARNNGVTVGDEITCTGSGAGTIAYRWLRNGSPIGGATGASYTTTGADAGTVVQCEVEAVASEGSSFRTSLPPHFVAPFADKEAPYVFDQTVFVKSPSGAFAEVGDEVTCDTGGFWRNDPTFSYLWLRDGTEIPGATGAKYTVAPADEGGSLSCRLTASNADGTVVAYSPPRPVIAAPPTVSEQQNPAISNLTDPGDAPEAGDQLSCSPGSWSDSPSFAYQWLRNGAPIGAATATTYTVVAADEGATLQCRIDATAAGTTQAFSNELVADPQPGEAPPARETWSIPGQISTDGKVGEAQSCAEGAWSGSPTLSYQWLLDGAEIAGATSQTYTPTPADLGGVLQCRVTATNASGSSVWTSSYAGDARPRVVIADVPIAEASAPTGGGATFAGIFGGHVFYADKEMNREADAEPADLFSYDVATGTTTQITDNGDAKFSHVSRDGSHVYFVSETEIGGEGSDGEPNLFVWSRADGSTTYITTVEPHDVLMKRNSQGEPHWGANVASWLFAMSPNKESIEGLGASDTRSTPDGSVFLFQTTAQLTSFNNTEAAPEDCGDSHEGGQRCIEIYRYDTATEDLTCVSCPPQGTGPATGSADLYEWGPISDLNPPNNLTADGNMVVFESFEDLLPQDGNLRKDVYRWKKGEGLALISTGQANTPSFLYAVSPSGNDITFLTAEKLLPQDENGGTERLYDARVNGGFPPDESVVTEPCSGDACQGNPRSAPEAPSIPSTSINGGGNVREKLRCPKGKRKVVRKGKERCVKRKGKQQRRNKGSSKQGSNR